MTAPTVTRPQLRCDRCHHTLAEPDDLGLGYSREPETDLTPVRVPDGVEGISLTGRARLSTALPSEVSR